METNYTTTAFTVDLNQLGFGNTPTITNTTNPLGSLPPDLTRIPLDVDGRIEFINITDYIAPGKKYQVIDIDGQRVGFINSDPLPEFNIDEETEIDDPDYSCDSVKELDSMVTKYKAALAILSITVPDPDDPHPHRSNVETIREWLVKDAPRRRQELIEEERDDAEEEAERKTSCNGEFDRRTGEIAHDQWCPIHLSN